MKKSYLKNDPEVINDFDRFCAYLHDISIYLENSPKLKTDIFDNVLNDFINSVNTSVFNAIDEAKERMCSK